MHEFSFKVPEAVKENAAALLKWIVFAVLVGLTVGTVGSAFHIVLDLAAELRLEHPWLLYCLPLAGIAIVAAYRFTGMADDKGTEMVLSSIRSGKPMRLRTAPLIFLATSLTHLCGGSAGREGAALQGGGSISSGLGKMLSLEPEDERIITMCGMAAGFSALFGTPLAAAVFAMEVANIGVMYYAAIVPCVLSALLAQETAQFFGLHTTVFAVPNVPAMDINSIISIVILGLLCGILANVFCRVMHLGGAFYRKITSSPWIKAIVGGVIIIFLTLLVGSADYNGAGMDVIQYAIAAGRVVPAAFVLKLIFTSLTLNAGYKGGEIVPSFFVGATFGCVVGPMLGLSPSFAAAVSMIAVFCGVTNSPMTSILLGYELFIGVGVAPMALVSAISYVTSGNSSLYHLQTITHSKIHPHYAELLHTEENKEE